MRGRARAFYASLFSPDLTNAETHRMLRTELPTVSVGDRDRLELPLSLAELSEALRRIPTNKSLGTDRLIVEFYSGVATLFSPELRPEVLGVTEVVPGRLLDVRAYVED
ncbi:unnamed protein product [Caretta caretta]